MPTVFVCRRCRGNRRLARKSPWRCRACGRYTCEHLCGLKDKRGMATCVRCSMLHQSSIKGVMVRPPYRIGLD